MLCGEACWVKLHFGNKREFEGYKYKPICWEKYAWIFYLLLMPLWLFLSLIFVPLLKYKGLNSELFHWIYNWSIVDSNLGFCSEFALAIVLRYTIGHFSHCFTMAKEKINCWSWLFSNLLLRYSSLGIWVLWINFLRFASSISVIAVAWKKVREILRCNLIQCWCKLNWEINMK